MLTSCNFYIFTSRIFTKLYSAGTSILSSDFFDMLTDCLPQEILYHPMFVTIFDAI